MAPPAGLNVALISYPLPLFLLLDRSVTTLRKLPPRLRLNLPLDGTLAGLGSLAISIWMSLVPYVMGSHARKSSHRPSLLPLTLMILHFRQPPACATSRAVDP